MLDDRKKLILDRVHYEIRSFGGTLAEYLVQDHINLCDKIDENTKVAIFTNANDIQLGDVMIHGSKIAYLKEKYPNIKTVVLARQHLHFKNHDLYNNLECVDAVHPVDTLTVAKSFINSYQPCSIVYNRGKVYHDEMEFGKCTTRLNHDNMEVGEQFFGKSRLKPKLCIHLRMTRNCPWRNYSLQRWEEFIKLASEVYNIVPIAHVKYDVVPNEIAGLKVIKQSDLQEVLGILSVSDMFVGPDTGILHLAATFKHLRCVSLVNLSHEWNNYFPYHGNKYTILSKNLDNIPPNEIFETLYGNREYRLIPSRHEKKTFSFIPEF